MDHLEHHSRRVEDVPQPRLVSINDPDAEKLKAANNSIKTSKYNPITFLPVFLLEMFSRVAYLYFLIQVLVFNMEHRFSSSKASRIQCFVCKALSARNCGCCLWDGKCM